MLFWSQIIRYSEVILSHSFVLPYTLSLWPKKPKLVFYVDPPICPCLDGSLSPLSLLCPESIDFGETPTLQTPIVGEDAVIKCMVTANPSPQVDWLRDGLPLRTGEKEKFLSNFENLTFILVKFNLIHIRLYYTFETHWLYTVIYYEV